MKITIQNLPCSYSSSVSDVCTSSSVTIWNKRRENLIIDVPVSLTLQNIIIDSIDSILSPSEPCLSTRKKCCKVEDDGTIANADKADPTAAFSCSSEFSSLYLSEDCQVNMP